jgi:hypothetical protein
MEASVWLTFILAMVLIITDFIFLFIFQINYFEQEVNYNRKKGIPVYTLLVLDVLFALSLALFIVLQRNISTGDFVNSIPFIFVTLMSNWKLFGFLSLEGIPNQKFKKIIGISGAVSLPFIIGTMLFFIL